MIVALIDLLSHLNLVFVLSSVKPNFVRVFASYICDLSHIRCRLIVKWDKSIALCRILWKKL